MSTVWTPHLTVAAVIEHNRRFLMVEEYAEGRTVLNQPAGHVEENESIPEAVMRETLEETGRRFSPENLIGIYRWRSPHNLTTYLRVCYSGQCTAPVPDTTLDSDIIATHWLSYEEIAGNGNRLRSPLVMRCIDDYLDGKQLPINLINELN